MIGIVAVGWTLLGGIEEPVPKPAMDVARYTEIVASEPGLLSFWRMEGSLEDQQGNQPVPDLAGGAHFAEGPGGGQALDLSSSPWLELGTTPHLDTDEASVEFLFCLTDAPTGEGNPCLLAKRNDAKTRYSIHVRADLKGLGLWNGQAIRWIMLPEEAAIEVGRWYHLVAVSGRECGFVFYLDGVPCPADGMGAFNVVEDELPLLLGVATPGGKEVCRCQLDELAIYARPLSAEDVARHADALGWADRRRALSELIAPLAAAREERAQEARAQREGERQTMLADTTLCDRGEPRIYREEHLEAISLPVGGIGSGLIQMNGYAEPHIWQIFNNYQGVRIPHSFLAVRAQEEGGAPVVRALQGKGVDGFEPMDELSFQGRYPFGSYAFSDAELPVDMVLEVFNPFIPMDPRDSGIPCAIFKVCARNISPHPVNVRLLASLQNAVGCSVIAPIEGVRNSGYGGNEIRKVNRPGLTALFMGRSPAERGEGDKPCCSSCGCGNMTLAVLEEAAEGVVSWLDPVELHTSFLRGAMPPQNESAQPSPTGTTHNGALVCSMDLAPGEERETAFLLTWYFPIEEAGRWAGSGLMYTNWWRDSLDVALDVAARFETLERRTRDYVEVLYESNLPLWLLDRISSQAGILRTKTCYWGADGYVGAWEGCCPSEGCCLGNCGHVWHYAQAHARLFPSLARTMREQALRHEVDGGLLFRQSKDWTLIAADAQCGEILGCYREHLCDSNDQWLRREWQRIRKAMDYAIRQWDPDGNGLMSGAQHNTLDCNSTGTSSWLGGLYLAALEAAGHMAEIVGDEACAARYGAIREAGAAAQNERLWNGEYYMQVSEEDLQYDYLDGCHIDQVLGEWWAFQTDLPHAYPGDRVRNALRSLFQHNFQPDFHEIPQVPRKFVSDDDAGMQMITWPHGGRPTPHTLYADEVMTGFEYAAAATMVHYGLLQEGLLTVSAIANRYDGRIRRDVTDSKHASWGYTGNPFGDDECGKFYARAMSSWSLLLACQGFVYDGPAGRIGFAPVWRPEDHRSFFTGAAGWGLYSQQREKKEQLCRLEIRGGSLELCEFVAVIPEDREVARCRAEINGEEVTVDCEQLTDGRMGLRLLRRFVLRAGEAIEFRLKLR